MDLQASACTGTPDACDFFCVETVLLKTLYVLVFMHIRTRRILEVGVSANPDGPWVTQQARNLVMDLEGDTVAPRDPRWADP